jgi:hypothetical protein
VSKALIDGLKAAVFSLEKADEMSPEKREAAIEELIALISQSEQAYKGKSPDH